MFPGDLFLDELDRLRFDGGILQVDQGDPELQGEGLGDLPLRGHPEGDDHLPQFPPLRVLLREGPREPLLAQQAGLDEQFPKPFLRHSARVLLAGGGFPGHTPSYNKGETVRNRNWNQIRSRGIVTVGEERENGHQR